MTDSGVTKSSPPGIPTHSEHKTAEKALSHICDNDRLLEELGSPIDYSGCQPSARVILARKIIAAVDFDMATLSDYNGDSKIQIQWCSAGSRARHLEVPSPSLCPR